MHSHASKPVHQGDGGLAWLAMFVLVELGMVLGIGVFGMGLSPSVGLLVGLVVLCLFILTFFAMTDGQDEEQLSPKRQAAGGTPTSAPNPSQPTGGRAWAAVKRRFLERARHMTLRLARRQQTVCV